MVVVRPVKVEVGVMVTADQKLASSANLLAMLGGKQTAFVEHFSGHVP